MYRWLFGSLSVFCVILIAVALYFEHVMGMQPCPLCIFQRMAVIFFGIIALLAAIHNPANMGRRIYAGLLFLSAFVGALVAGRHVWLQSLPKDQVPECGPGLDYIMEVFPIFEALQFVLKGSGECAEASWTFLSLTIPGWTLLVFIGFIVFSLYIFFCKREGK